MKKQIAIFGLSFGLLLGTVALSFRSVTQVEAGVDHSPETNPDMSKIVNPSTYYRNIDTSHKGDTLKSDLYNLIKGHTNYNYDRAEAAMAIVDRDWVKSPDPSDTNPYMILLYADYNDTNCQTWDKSYGGFGSTVAGQYSWDKEHMWAKSNGNFGTSAGPGSDLHHLRAADKQINNGSRGSEPYGKVTSGSYCKDVFGNTSTNKVGNGVFEPGDQWKGDCARALFYMATRYGSPDSHNLRLSTGTESSGGVWGYLDTLLEWNEFDPPDAREVKRNDMVSIFQQNRNPYIDHPEYARAVFKNEAIVAPHELTDLTVTGTPITSYKEGQKFNSSGLTVTATFDDGATQNVTQNVVWTPESLTVETTEVIGTYSYGNITKSVKITGITVIGLENVEMSGNPSKTTYNSGDSFDPTGISIVATYTNGTTENVTSEVTWSPDPLTKGVTEVIGTYGGYTFTVGGLTVNGIEGYKISFAGLSGDTQLTDSQILSSISEGAEYVSSISNSVKIFKGNNALKIGSGSADGSFKINLASSGQGVIEKIKVVAKPYSGSATLNIGTNYESPTSGKSLSGSDFAEYVYQYSTSGTLQNILVSAKDRVLLQSIEVVTGGSSPVDPPQPVDVPVTGVTINTGATTLDIGQTVQLSWTVAPSNATNKNASFSLSNTGVVSVNSTGLITALTEGSTVVTIKTEDGNFTASVAITVRGEEPIDPPGPVDPVDPPIQQTNNKCGGSVIATSVVLSFMSLIGIGLITFKKRKI